VCGKKYTKKLTMTMTAAVAVALKKQKVAAMVDGCGQSGQRDS
jgi:hypothetical protein